jgi:opacity protein-like surface antigen
MSGIRVAGGALAALVAITTCVVPSSSAAAATVVPPENVQIRIETINGSGCRAGTAAVAMNADNTAFTVTYSDYLAAAGEGISPLDFRKNCQLALRVDVPGGFTYAIQSVDYRGYAFLDGDASGLQRAGYYFQGSPDTTYSTQEFEGAYDDNWHTNDEKEWAELVWSPCGEQRNFNINTELRVYADRDGPVSLMTMDSTDSAVSTIYHMAWEEC